MHFTANHGYHQHEKENGGDFTVDIYMYMPLHIAGKTDQLSDTVNYEEVYIIVKDVLGETKDLLETLAFSIIDKTHQRFRLIETLRVRVTKHNPPLEGQVDRSFVDITKELTEKSTNSNYWEERAKY